MGFAHFVSKETYTGKHKRIEIKVLKTQDDY